LDNLEVGVSLPREYVTQKCAILAVTGSGKSYGVGGILEEFCKQDMPFVMFDVMGAHWGLAEKYKVIIFGGRKGETLDKTRGVPLARYVFETDDRVIFDLSEWNDFEMQEFVAQFLHEIFRLHGENRKPRHIFVEEAEVFFPQTNYDSSRESLLAGNKVMKRGRSFGLGMTLITQRPQDVNKKTLSQSQCTFIMHMEGLQEMEVINKMLRNDPNRVDHLDKVLHFQKGECLLYSPSWLGEVKTFKFRKRETYHAGDTPSLDGSEPEPEIIEHRANLIEELPEEEKVELETQKSEGNNNKAILLLACAVILLITAFVV